MRAIFVYAENTHTTLDPQPSPWNYLRMRGEYLSAVQSLFSEPELPPRARRIRDYKDHGA